PLNVRPPYVFGGFAEEVPVFAVVVRQLEKKNLLQIGNFGREKVAMLVADLFWRAGKADHRPSAERRLARRAVEQTGVLTRRRRSRGTRKSESGRADRYGEQNHGKNAAHEASRLRQKISLRSVIWQAN